MTAKSAPRRKSAKEKRSKRSTQKSKRTSVRRKRSDQDDTWHIKIKDNTPAANTVPFSKERLQLALLSPLRYPINYDRLASQTARYSGMFFVVAGAIFALIHIQELNSFYADLEQQTHVAEIVCSNPEDPEICEETENENAPTDPCDPESVYYDSELCENPEMNDPPLNFEPNVDFEIESPEPLSGLVKLRLAVESALSVEVVAFELETEDYYTLGPAEYINDGLWEFDWDTTAFNDDKYTLKALITNAFGTYDASHTSYVDVRNADVPPEEDEADDDVFDEMDQNPVDELAEEDEAEGHQDLTDELADADFVRGPGELIESRPPVDIDLEDSAVLSNVARIRMEVDGAEFIELYVMREVSLTPQFIGLAQRRDASKWEFNWDSRETPNGTYRFFARVKNILGLYDSRMILVTVSNQIKNEVTDTEAEKIESLSEDSILDIEENGPDPEESRTDTKLEEDAEKDPADNIIANLPYSELEMRDATESIIAELNEKLNALRNTLARAVRDNDETRLRAVQAEMINIRTRAVLKLHDVQLEDTLIDEVDTYIEKLIKTFEEDTQHNEEIIRERIGNAVFNDSDSDGISDYDEINLYKTDPFSADSDGDGFDDGSEILGSFDPRDSTSETFIAYESPQETGVVREDIFEVTSITAIQPDEADTFSDGVRPVAIIKGKGLPNSFVTLYIFSTPIVVTVKTDDDGSWEYTFERELEDGEHEVYVGVTDNAGRIVAKSNPLPFIKTAEAFTPVGATTHEPTAISPLPENTEPAVLTEKMIVVVASIGVVMIGVLLLLLGLHIQTRPTNLAMQ